MPRWDIRGNPNRWSSRRPYGFTVCKRKRTVTIAKENARVLAGGCVAEMERELELRIKYALTVAWKIYSEQIERLFERTFRKHFFKLFIEKKFIIIRKHLCRWKPIKKIDFKEVYNTIYKDLNAKKTPDYDNGLITSKILRELSGKALRLLTIIYNAVLRLNYFLAQWKIAQIILLSKPGKNPEELILYRLACCL